MSGWGRRPPQPSFPRKRESGGDWTAKGRSFQYRGDSRLRGNDGGGGRPSTVGIPAYAGMTVGRPPPSTVGISAYAGRTVGRPPPLYRRDSRLRGKDGGETAALYRRDSRLRGNDGGEQESC